MKKLERADLVLVIKDLNQGLNLKPAIRTKVGDKFVADDELKKTIINVAKGWNEETKKFVADDAVSRETTKLSDHTWEVLDILLASDKKAPAKADKKAVATGKPALKAPETKTIRQPKEVRSAGRFPTEFKALKKHLEGLTGEISLAREYDRQLMNKATLAEHLAVAEKIQKRHGVSRSIIPHIKWRIENDGWLFKDTRKFQHDASGTVQIIGTDPSLAKKVKMDMPLKATAPAKVKKADKAEKTAEAKKPAKADKVSTAKKEPVTPKKDTKDNPKAKKTK